MISDEILDLHTGMKTGMERINIQVPAQITPLVYYKTISMQFCNITISHSSTPYDILGEMFKLKL